MRIFTGVAVLLLVLFMDFTVRADDQQTPVAGSAEVQIKPIDIKSAPAVSLPGTRQFSMKSTVGQREYRIFVNEPKGELPQNGLPVMYVLDGNATFPSALEAARRALRTQGPMLIVGIGYPTDEQLDSGRRSYDFTPATTKEKLARLPRRGGVMQTGGQDEFLTFIEKDLKPVIEANFTVDRGRQTLLGHSLGGLFVLHALFTSPNSFQAYVAISPSVWWSDMAILTEERAFAEKHGARADLLITVGEREKAHMVDDAREMSQRLNKLSGSGLRVTYKPLTEEDHGSVVAASLGHAVRFSQEAGPR